MMLEFKNNKLTKLLNITYPIIQGGMVWVSGSKLAISASTEGCLGTLGAGSMTNDLLVEHIKKVQQSTNKPFAVNLPIMYHGIEKQVDICLNLGVKIFIMSAGSPKLYTEKIKSFGAKVLHVTSSPKLAMKCQNAGVDAIIVEGFEAGGHVGRDELTSMVLIPQVRKIIDQKIPVICAGGIASGEQMLAALALGADGVQIGSRFAVCDESSAHDNFKQAVCNALPNDTMVMLKKLAPVRLLANQLTKKIKDLENQGATSQQLTQKLDKNLAKAGIFDGDLDHGKLEIGQVSGMINVRSSFGQNLKELLQQYIEAKHRLCSPCSFSEISEKNQ